MYNSVLKTLLLSVSAYLKGNFKSSIPYRHFSIIETYIYCALLFFYNGWCIFLFIYYMPIEIFTCYFGYWCVFFIYFQINVCLWIGFILLQFWSLHNHCFGIHLCICVVCRYVVFIRCLCFSSLCVRSSHFSFRMCLKCEMSLFSWVF